MDIQNFIEDKINDLWDKYSRFEFTKFPPLAPKIINSKNTILFIGLNPSLSKNEINRIQSNSITKAEFYSNHKNEKTIHKYFKKFIDISQKTNIEWEHIDLLYLRETRKREISNILKTQTGIDFVYEQLKITEEILNRIFNEEKPKLVIVNNTLSRLFLGKDRNNWLNLDFNWNENIGTYEHKNIPFFFTSMLTGQRALDIGSYERLIWQIKQLKKRTPNNGYK